MVLMPSGCWMRTLTAHVPIVPLMGFAERSGYVNSYSPALLSMARV